MMGNEGGPDEVLLKSEWDMTVRIEVVMRMVTRARRGEC